MYAKYFKRVMDFFLSLMALIVLSPIFVLLIVVGAVAMKGNPFFVQPRPGKKDKEGNEKIFKLIKFRTMDNRKDEDGNLLPDDVRLNLYGKFLRSTSLDELPELINILKGDMAVIGPRPQLVRDMVFMSEYHRLRHTVRPGLSGLAQISGRNSIDWKNKLDIDLEYIENITFFGDWKIIFITIFKVFKREDVSMEGMETAEDYGDYLLRIGEFNEQEYNALQLEAKELLEMV
ncbi:MAG: sugar transferase [Clostridia bacterium]|nr:sugar transferase [Clostridia bacterium]